MRGGRVKIDWMGAFDSVRRRAETEADGGGEMDERQYEEEEVRGMMLFVRMRSEAFVGPWVSLGGARQYQPETFNARPPGSSAIYRSIKVPPDAVFKLLQIDGSCWLCILSPWFLRTNFRVLLGPAPCVHFWEPLAKMSAASTLSGCTESGGLILLARY